jgi:hypothetical protein
VPTPDLDDERDDRFEAYLKQFHPLAVEPLQVEKSSRATRRSFVLAVLSAAAVILLIAIFAMHSRIGRTDDTKAVASSVDAERLANTQPLTMRSANALLATAPSFEAAIDEMAFPPQTTPLPKDQHSALDVLSKEKIKP